MKSLLMNSQRIIIKVGSSLVTNQGEGLDQKAIASWVEQIAHLVKSGKEIVLVTSGAVAEGNANYALIPQAPDKSHLVI